MYALDKRIQNLFVGIPLVYALYLIYVCPCKTVLGCKKVEYIASLGFSAGFFAFFNASPLTT